MKRDKIALLAKALQINPVSLITGDECIETKQSKSNNNSDIVLNSHEMKVILAYRKQPSMQEAVDRLLHIENEAPELIPSLIAARSVNNDEPIKAEKVQDFSKIKPTDKKL
jgi:CRISPR/Cas system CSM-associated protein Csm2 small subunit